MSEMLALEGLPFDVLVHILSFVTARDLREIAKTCKLLNFVSSSDVLWIPLAKLCLSKGLIRTKNKQKTKNKKQKTKNKNKKQKTKNKKQKTKNKKQKTKNKTIKESSKLRRCIKKYQTLSSFISFKTWKAVGFFFFFVLFI